MGAVSQAASHWRRGPRPEAIIAIRLFPLAKLRGIKPMAGKNPPHAISK